MKKSMLKGKSICVLLLAVVLLSGTGAAQSYTLIGLGDLPGGSTISRARAINDSGQVVGVSYVTNSSKAFIWDSENGMVNLGALPGGGTSGHSSNARDINNSGQVVGSSRTENGTGSEAFIWDSTNGMVALGDLPGGGFRSTARAINDSGQVVGYGDSENNDEAFIWDATNGMTALGDLPGGQTWSFPLCQNT